VIDLRDKPIAITGASSGIGRATAVACAIAGMPVALSARRTDRLEQVASEIRASGGRAIAVTCDVTDPAQCMDLIDRTVREFGSIYAVFANAGFGFERAMHETSDSDLRAIFETNFFGTMHTIQPALPHMIRERRGHVLICSSCIGKIGIPYYGAYCATKAAQTIVGRAMRHELRPLGIHVSTVHPVLTDTEFGQVARRHTGSTRLADEFRSRAKPPEHLARSIVRCLRHPRTEVWPSLFVRYAFACLNASPLLADLVLDRVAKKRRK
jgi:short-subunit dehydrogenase